MRVEYDGFAGIWDSTMEYGKALLSDVLQRRICVHKQCRETISNIPTTHFFDTFRTSNNYRYLVIFNIDIALFLANVHRNMQMAGQ